MNGVEICEDLHVNGRAVVLKKSDRTFGTRSELKYKDINNTSLPWKKWGTPSSSCPSDNDDDDGLSRRHSGSLLTDEFGDVRTEKRAILEAQIRPNVM